MARAGEIARRFHASHVELRHQDRLTDLPARQHKVSVRKAAAGVDRTRCGTRLDRKVRNQVRKAQKSGFTVDVGRQPQLSKTSTAVFAENMRDLGTPVYSKRLFSSALAQFPERARICVVSHDGQACGRWFHAALNRNHPGSMGVVVESIRHLSSEYASCTGR